jgi:hypothetical protein
MLTQNSIPNIQSESYYPTTINYKRDHLRLARVLARRQVMSYLLFSI